jgi:hypothetical protein
MVTDDRLAIVPLQGRPLRPRALFAAVVLRDLGDAAGRRLGQPAELAALIAGQRPAGLGDAALASYRRALAAIAAAGIDPDDVAALAAFTTGDPTEALGRFRAHALAGPRPAPKRPFVAREVFEDYCVFESALDVPVYQQGEPPYSSSGGGWPGEPAVDHLEEARLFVTLPRRPAAGGVPVAVFVRTGGGGDRPLVDRGRQDASGAAIAPGEGPALHFARAGFAGVSLDGPLGGPLRNPNALDEQFAIFNVFNGRALRDNVRQSALELILLAHVLPDLEIDASSCPGAAARLDVGRLALMGHSTGAWIAVLVLAFEPRYRAAILSGAGASWIENVLHKERPVAVAPVVGGLLGVPRLSAAEPALTLLQWAAEPADPQVHAGMAAQHVLMLQGIVDHYILPRIANAVSLPLGLDLGGDALDAAAGLPAAQLPLAPLLRMTGGAHIALPAEGNRGARTAVVVQHPDDGLQDGHETVFQRDEPKAQYRCFLASFAQGTPRVPAPGGPCD